MTKYSVLIVEDDEIIQQRLSDLLTADDRFELLVAVETRQAGLDALKKYTPDLLLTDIGLPDGSGVDIVRAIYENGLSCQALVISGFQDEHIVFNALEAGAKGYIHKHDQAQQITDSLISILEGGAPISPVIARLMLKRFQTAQRVVDDLPESLTERQIHILKLISQGFSSREIAEKLDISYYTVTTHIKNIYTKLQVNSRMEALHEAMRLGLL